MPFPRFNKLDPEKRRRLLETAAREFAAHGYLDASLNRILVQAGISKGTAYYYFADKADLFTATIAFCREEIDLIDETLDPATLTAATYWSTFARLHREPLLRSLERPWIFGALKAAERISPVEAQMQSVADLAQRLLTYVMRMVERGQTLGVIRDDLPGMLLFAWLEAIDRASDDWLLARWSEQTAHTLTRFSDETVEAMRRAVAP
jgi:AcrR family transcriptional regulator